MTGRNELERLLAAATEGPWAHSWEYSDCGAHVRVVHNALFATVAEGIDEDDAALICFLQNNAQHFIALMDKVDRLRGKNEVLREVLADLVSWFPKKPSEPEWRLSAGPHGADDAINAARQALGETHDN